MQMPKWFIAYLFTICPIIMLCLITIITGKAIVSYHGFAVDSDLNVYLGKDGTIEVLDVNGVILRNISSYTSKGYKFTITKDNIIQISTGDYLYETDTSGNLISKKEIFDYTDDQLIGLNRNKYIASDGTKYVMKNHLLRTCIYRVNGNQKSAVYKMPLFDYIVKILAILCFFSLIIVVPICIIKCRKPFR